jgi:hypothetical protein
VVRTAPMVREGVRSRRRYLTTTVPDGGHAHHWRWQQQLAWLSRHVSGIGLDVRLGHDADVVFEVRRASDGGRALPVFTTVERLVATLGPEQPWAALPLRNIQHLMSAAGVPTIVIDPGAEPGAWRWQMSDLEDLARRQ